MQTKMTNADKPIGENMGKKAADELRRGEGHEFGFAFIAIVEIFESHLVAFHGDNAMIANGNTEDVATKIFEQFFDTIERSLDIDFPILSLRYSHHMRDIQLTIISI